MSLTKEKKQSETVRRAQNYLLMELFFSYFYLELLTIQFLLKHLSLLARYESTHF
jgi:hypothetical protein